MWEGIYFVTFMTALLQWVQITSNRRVSVQMQYGSAAQYAKSSPCSSSNPLGYMSFISFQSPTNNLEIQCSVPSSKWAFHWYHSTPNYRTTTGGHICIIRRKEEKALKIEEHVTDLYRKVHNIPDTDGLLEMREEWEKRKRSDTISTVSDKPGSKKSKVDTIQE